jgi:hypothetical protein
LTEKVFRQTVDELVQRFYVKCGVKKGDGGAPWVPFLIQFTHKGLVGEFVTGLDSL